MKTLTNYDLQHDLYSIIEAGILLHCKEVNNKYFIEWVITENPQYKKEYYYPNRKLMVDDHYELAKFHFAIN